MVNTVILAAVTLASLFNVVWGTVSENSVNLEISGQTNGTNLMPEKDYGFDYGKEDDGFDYRSSITERKKCPASKKCTDAGGSCIKSQADCDGTVNTRACKGKKCKCCTPAHSSTDYPVCPTCPTVPQGTTVSTTTCPPIQPCPTVPQCTTIPTQSTAETQAPTTVTGIAGFELFRGKVIRRTTTSDAKGNYTSGISFCNQFEAKPFIPQTSADYDLYRDVRTSLGTSGYMWIPADDHRREGILSWYNGASVTNTSLFDWRFNQTLFQNRNTWDCVFYGLSGSKPDMHMHPCDGIAYPPICHLYLSYGQDGFELFRGRVIRKPTTSDAKGNYTTGMSFCSQFGAKPFIPQTSLDYGIVNEARTALNSNMWFPADDRQEEGTLRWYNGSLVSNTSLSHMDWHNNRTMYGNSASYDCVIYLYASCRHPVAYVHPCGSPFYPPICEKI